MSASPANQFICHLCGMHSCDSISTTCGHPFHLNCIRIWLLTNSWCPLCGTINFIHNIAMVDPSKMNLKMTIVRPDWSLVLNATLIPLYISICNNQWLCCKNDWFWQFYPIIFSHNEASPQPVAALKLGNWLQCCWGLPLLRWENWSIDIRLQLPSLFCPWGLS